MATDLLGIVTLNHNFLDSKPKSLMAGLQVEIFQIQEMNPLGLDSVNKTLFNQPHRPHRSRWSIEGTAGHFQNPQEENIAYLGFVKSLNINFDDDDDDDDNYDNDDLLFDDDDDDDFNDDYDAYEDEDDIFEEQSLDDFEQMTGEEDNDYD